MWGSGNGWDPWAYRDARHPDVRVIEMDLSGRLQGCVDHVKRIIWLTRGLSETQARCTLAYEIGQLEQGPTPSHPCLARAQQRAAEEWAALMLIPPETFAAAWANCLELDEMAGLCGVDLPTFRARIRAASNADQDRVMDVIRASRMAA